MHNVVLKWQAGHAKIGKHIDLGERLCFGFHFYIGDSKEQCIRDAAKYYEENMKMFGELRLSRSHDRRADRNRCATRCGRPPRSCRASKTRSKLGGFLTGSAAEIIDHLKKLEKAYPGLDRVSISPSLGVPEAVILEQLERFAKDVMPAFERYADRHQRTGDGEVELTGLSTMAPRVYLAGPMVFDPDPVAIFDRMKALCLPHGVVGIAPLDNQIGLEGIAPGKKLLEQIVRADIALMEQLEAAVFCLDGFRRGPEMDAGTAFEVGYMKALGKPIAGWTRDTRLYPQRVAGFIQATSGSALRQTAAGSVGATSGSLRDPDGVLVHSEDCYQNAMVHVGIELAGGTVVADADWERAFSLAVASVAEQLRLKPNKA